MANRDLARFENVRHRVHTNSSLGDLGICERLWFWKHVARKEIARTGFARSLFKGVAFHELIDSRIVDHDGDAVEQIKIAVQTAFRRFENFDGVDIEKETLEVTGVLRAYLDWEVNGGAPLTKWASGIIPEVPWLQHWTRSSKVVLAGVLDAIGVGVTGAPVIYEHKTTSERDLIAYLNKLKVDPQILIYAWAVWKKFGVLPEGIVYTVVRNYAPRELRFKKNGEMYAGDVTTDKATFERCFQEAGRTMDSMNDHEREQYEIACKRQWVVREFWPIRQEDVERWQHENEAKIKRASFVRRNPKMAITNRLACRSLWGRECQYIELCDDRWVADDLYQIRSSAEEVERALKQKPLLRKTTIDVTGRQLRA